MILGLSGYARSGKDTIAEYLVEKYGFVRMGFADPMREAIARLDPWIDFAGLRIPLSEALRITDWDGLKEESNEIRPLLQRMGTEVGREMFGEDIWVNYLISKAHQHDRVVVSDVRFENEARAIHRSFGSVWRIDRPGVEAANDHVSEHDLDEFPFDIYITNAHTKEHLYDAVDMLIGNVID
jgi:hypothetical protein